MNTVADIRPYQSAVRQAERHGFDRQAAVHAVAAERRDGRTGALAVGRMQLDALRARPTDDGPRAA